MNVALNFPGLAIRRSHYWLMAMALVAITGGVIAFPLLYVSNNNVVIGFCLLPFALFVHAGHRFNFICFGLMLFFGVTACMYSVRIFYFFAIAFYLIFMIEWCIGRVNPLILFALLFMSPFFEQVAVILGFPIRLQLSALSGNLLWLAGLDVHVEGNMMLLNGKTFTVDEACMGLNMLAISLLMGLFIMAHQYRVRKLSVNLFQLTAFFTAVFVLNLISNLLRIMTLVMFNIGPEHPMHEVVGVLSLAVYVMVPLYVLGKWMVGRFGKPYTHVTGQVSIIPYQKILLIGLAIIILLIGIRISDQRSDSRISHARVSLQGFEVVNMKDGITKMYNKDLLVYVKPIPEFFSGEHTPLLCWQGSGYEFRNVKKVHISGREIYFGKLVSEGSALYSAWWYSNGNIETIDQFEWRARMFRGEERFCIVNVTATDEDTLREHLKGIFEENKLTFHDESNKQ